MPDEYDLTLTAGSQTVRRRKNVWDGTVAPGVDDDTTRGLDVGSIWLDAVGEAVYLCADATAGAAVWIAAAAGPGGGTGDTLSVDLSVSGATDVDRATAATHDLTLTGDATLTPIHSAVVAGTATDLRILIRQDGTGGWTLAWGGTIAWATPGAVEPTMPLSPGDLLTVGFLSVDDAATWLGYVVDTTAPAGSIIADDTIWDAAGDIVQADGADSAVVLSLGAAGTVPSSTGSLLAYAYPPGYEFTYVEFTSPVSITATGEGTANTVVTSSGVAYDGSTIVMIEFFAPYWNADSTAAGRTIVACLYDGASSIGFIGQGVGMVNGTVDRRPVMVSRRLTPSNATHTYSIRVFVNAGTGSVAAGAGGAAAYEPGYIRITKA